MREKERKREGAHRYISEVSIHFPISPRSACLSVSLRSPCIRLIEGRIRGYASLDAFSRRLMYEHSCIPLLRFIYSYTFIFKINSSLLLFVRRHLPSSRFPSYCVASRLSLIRETLVKARHRSERKTPARFCLRDSIKKKTHAHTYTLAEQ